MSIAPPLPAPNIATDAELEASLQHFLSTHNDQEGIWVFTYGSLIWSPDFTYQERRIGLLKGYHRALCLWSRMYRGTPESPGLVFGLDHGGECHGVVYLLKPQQSLDDLRVLWKRELQTGDYIPKWVHVDTEFGTVKAISFIINTHGVAYAHGLSETQQLHIVQQAQGRKGRCLDYVMQTAQALTQHQIHDPDLNNLVTKLSLLTSQEQT